MHLLLIGGYPLVGLLLHLRAGRLIRGPALTGSVRGLLIVCAIELSLFSMVFAIGWLFSRASREELMFSWRPGWWVVPLGIVYSIAVRLGTLLFVMVVVAIVLVLQAATPQELQQYVNANRPTIETLVSVSAMRSNPAYYWLMVTLVSFVLAGFREEVWRAATLAAMRVLWPRTFGSRAGQCVAVSLIAVLFGAMHLPMGPIAAVLAGILGLLLGLIIVLHQSIWPAVIAHGVFDATTIALLPWWLERIQPVR